MVALADRHLHWVGCRSSGSDCALLSVCEPLLSKGDESHRRPLYCGVPFLWRDILSIEIDCQYTRLRAAADPDCCSTVFSIYERGHLEITGCTEFYMVADGLFIGFCEW